MERSPNPIMENSPGLLTFSRKREIVNLFKYLIFALFSKYEKLNSLFYLYQCEKFV